MQYFFNMKSFAMHTEKELTAGQNQNKVLVPKNNIKIILLKNQIIISTKTQLTLLHRCLELTSATRI